MANNVQDSVLTNKDNILTIAREVVPLQATVAALQKEIEALKTTPSSPPQLANGTSQETSELTKIKAELAALKKKKLGSGGGGEGNGNGIRRRNNNNLPDINGWGKERSVRRYPDSTMWCWSCGFDLMHETKDCRHPKPGHKKDAKWNNRTCLPTDGSQRNCHFIIN